MRSRLGVGFVVVVWGLVGAASAGAANTYTLCSTGSGKAVVAPGAGGKCSASQKPLVLASSAALGSLQTELSSLKARLVSLTSLLSGVSRSGHTLTFRGMNVHLESGSGSTAGAVNGLGNLIIGYNENPGTQTGSNNLVVGNGQSFTSYGGIVTGQDNTISAPFASVTGGQFNLASDPSASIAGGCDNLAGTGTVPTNTCNSTGIEAILGGAGNHASGKASSVSGGGSNTSLGLGTSILGGQSETLSSPNYESQAGTTTFGP